MKKFSLIIIISLLLTSCTNTTLQITVVPTETLTVTPSLIPTPTLTQIPTATSIPALPDTIEFTFEEPISEETQNKIKAMVNQAYWFYVRLGCSPDGFRASFYTSKEGGEGGYADSDSQGVLMEAGVGSIDSNSSKTAWVISHEMAHAMCQAAFVQPRKMGAIDLRWLTEAVANYFSIWERITNTGYSYYGGYGYTTFEEWETSLTYIEHCEFSLSLLEPSNAHNIYPDKYFYGHTATVFLVKTTPDGIDNLINYYKLLNKENAATAFKGAFGRTKEEFYKEFQNECEQGFPSLVSPNGTATPKSVISIHGNLAFEDENKDTNLYTITFCNILKHECIPPVSIDNDGNFFIDLELGYYYYTASINSIDTNNIIGWYTKRGLVEDKSCADTIEIGEGLNIAILIDLQNIIACP